MAVIEDFERQLLKQSPYKYGRWWPVDLHNHSPTSRDYRGNRETALELTAQAIQRSNLALLMFTDHERLPEAGFIKELSKRTQRVILRGTELNVFVDAWLKPEAKVDKNLYFHVLVGFDPEQDPDYALKNIYQES